MGLKPKVKVVCPECDEPLRFTCFYIEGSSVSWVLSPKSRTHLEVAHPKRRTLHIVEEPYLAA